MKFKITVPVKPYLRKFLLFHNDWIEPIPVSQATFPGVVLFNLLERNVGYSRHEVKRSSHIEFELGESYASHYGVQLTGNSVLLFNNVMEEMFRHELYAKMDMVDLATGKKGNLIIKDAIISVAHKYELSEDDFSYENFRKLLYRYRKKKMQKRKKKFARFVP